MTLLFTTILLIGLLSTATMGQSSGDELQFGQNLSMQIRSDEIPFADDLPSEPERVLFGFSSASTDEILVVGAPHCDDRGSTRLGDFAGSVYIYMKDGEDWVPFPDIFGEPFPDGRDFKLYPSGLSAGDLFGWSVDIAKNTDGSHTLVVGAPGTRHAATGANDTGTVYVFDLPVNSYCWTQSPQSPLSLPSSFLSARAIPEEWEEAQPDAWLPPSELDLMAGIYSIPEERYGESVSLFSGELPKISGKDVTGIIAIGAPERDIYANVSIPDDPKKEDPPPNWQPVSEKAGAVFAWYRIDGQWVLPNAESGICLEAKSTELSSDPPELDEDDDFFCDSRRGRFFSSDLLETGSFFSELGRFGTKVQVVVDLEESASDRKPLLVASAIADRGGSGSVKWIDLDFPDNYSEDDYPFVYDPFATTVYPAFPNSAPSWAGQIGQDFDALPLGLGPQPPVTGVDFQLTVIGMPGRGNQGEVVVLTRDEDGGIFSIDRLNRLWTDNGFFPDRYVAGDLSAEELDEGYLAWSPWFGNPQYSNYPSMRFGTSVQFAGVSDDKSEFILVGAPALTGVVPDADPDDFDFDLLPDPDPNQFAMGGIFVFEYSGPNPGGPYFSLYQRTGLITSPDFLESSPAYRRLGEELVRLQLTPDEEDSLGDNVELFLVELAANKDQVEADFYRPRPSRLLNLVIDIDDMEDTSDIEDAFESSTFNLLKSSVEALTDISDFGFVTAVSEDGNWLAVGAPQATVPINRSSPYVKTENGNFFLADGAIYQSGEVYIYERTFAPKVDPTDGSGQAQRQERWDLHQVIRSPSTIPDLNNYPLQQAVARDVFSERFGFSLDLSPDGQTLLVGAYGGGGRFSFGDFDPNSSRGISYVFHRNDLEDQFAFTRPLFGKSAPGTTQGLSVSVSDDGSGSLLVSGAPFWSNTVLAEVRTGRVFSATHSNGNFSATAIGRPSTIQNETWFGATVAATEQGGQNIYAASSAGPATFVFTADEYRGGTVTVRRAGLDQTLIPTNISTEFGRSMSFNGDLLAVGSTGSAHFYDFSGSGLSAAFVFTPTVELLSDILGYPVPFDDGLTVSGLEIGLGVSPNNFSETIKISEYSGGLAMIGDLAATGSNQSPASTGAGILLDFNDAFSAPEEWDLLNPLLVLGERRLQDFGRGLSLGIDRRTQNGQIGQEYLRAYVAGKVSDPGSIGPEEPDCGGLIFNSPRLFRTRNQIFLYQDAFEDCNENGTPDSTEIAEDPSLDCNNDGILDDCQGDIFTDCNDNLVPDQCELEGQDCNGNGILDFCDIEDRNVDDVNADGIPDVCQCLGDVNQDGTVDAEDFNQVFDFIQASGQSDPPCLGCPEDVNNDGLVNILDLNYITTYSGTCP